MAQGLQVFDDTGALLVDTSTYTLKAFVNIGSVTSPGSQAVAELSKGSPLIMVAGGNGSYKPIVTANATHVIWTQPSGTTSMQGDIRVAIV